MPKDPIPQGNSHGPPGELSIDPGSPGELSSRNAPSKKKAGGWLEQKRRRVHKQAHEQSIEGKDNETKNDANPATRQDEEEDHEEEENEEGE